jgi:hypothetical protein
MTVYILQVNPKNQKEIRLSDIYLTRIKIFKK